MSLKKVLLADANPDCRELCRRYLEILGYPRPIEAEDGEQALHHALIERPGLIVMEIRLPKIDGFEIVARLRGNPATRDARILAATSMALERDREKCLAKGFHGYLAKPFTVQGLKESLLAVLSDHPKGAPP